MEKWWLRPVLLQGAKKAGVSSAVLGEKKPRGIRKVTQPPDVAKSHMWESAQKGDADH